MSNPTIRIHDLATNEVIDREMTNEEFIAYEEEQKAYADAKALEEKKESHKAALLTKLGITADEAKLLLS